MVHIHGANSLAHYQLAAVWLLLSDQHPEQGGLTSSIGTNDSCTRQTLTSSILYLFQVLTTTIHILFVCLGYAKWEICYTAAELPFRNCCTSSRRRTPCFATFAVTVSLNSSMGRGGEEIVHSPCMGSVASGYRLRSRYRLTLPYTGTDSGQSTNSRYGTQVTDSHYGTDAQTQGKAQAQVKVQTWIKVQIDMVTQACIRVNGAYLLQGTASSEGAASEEIQVEVQTHAVVQTRLRLA